MAQSAIVEGVVNFSNVTQHDVFNGQSTGAYSMTITLSEDDANQLATAGVKIKDYNGNKNYKGYTGYKNYKNYNDGKRYKSWKPLLCLFCLLYFCYRTYPRRYGL